MTNKPGKNRSPFVIVGLIFGVPLLFAFLFYQFGFWQPAQKTNNGTLLLPILSLSDTLPESPLHEVAGKRWQYLYVNTGECDQNCENALIRLRQTRLMLGNDMDRVVRVFLHGATPPDTVFLNEYHAGLITIHDPRLVELLARKRPAELSDGGIYLVDPLGNLVMYFVPELDPGSMVDDVEHLLDLSRIG